MTILSCQRRSAVAVARLLLAGLLLGFVTVGSMLTTALGQDIFVTNYTTSTVGEYTLSGSAVNPSLFTTGPTAIFSGSEPQSLAVSGSDVFVVNQAYNSIGEYSTSGGTINPSLVTGLNLPLPIAVSGSDLFVSNLNLGTIGEYTTSGATVNAALISGVEEPQGLAISGSDIFVATEFEDTIGEYTTSGGTVNASLIKGLNSPAGLVVSGSDIFVANYNSGTIGEYTTSGATINAALVTGLEQPIGLALSGSDLFVANSNGGSIGEYTTSGGTVNASLISGLNAPHGIAITPAPTPEPGTLALVVAAAIGLLGYGWRRHRAARHFAKPSALQPGLIGNAMPKFPSRRRSELIVAFACAAALCASNASSQTLTTLVAFTGTGGTANGAYPYGSLILSGTTLYGMTNDGGNSSGLGNIFSVGMNGMNYQNLVSFTGGGGTASGLYPDGSLLASGSTLYGMTSAGGGNGDGNVFSVGTNGTNYQNLVSFTGSGGTVAGAVPYGSLIASGSTLYGMTSEKYGFGNGNIFSVGMNGTNYQNLVSFTGTGGTASGEAPQGSLILSGTTLFGMTDQGGVHGLGNIFSVGIDGSGYDDLYDFSGGAAAPTWLATCWPAAAPYLA